MAAQAAMLFSVLVSTTPAHAQSLVLEVGTGLEDFEPTLGAQFSDGFTIGKSHLITHAEARLPVTKSYDLFGDMQINVGAEIVAPIRNGFTVTANVNYDFERNFEETTEGAYASVESQHGVGSSIGFSWQGEAIRIDADVANDATLFEDFLVPEVGEFDRRFRDHVDTEAALRVVLGQETGWMPFVEGAYIGRNYLQSDARNFWGPELIGGVEVKGMRFNGQIAAILAHRRQLDGTDHVLFGPYVDIVWKPNSASEIMFALGSSFAQESIGDDRVYEILSATFGFEHQLTDKVKVAAKLEGIIEYDSKSSETLTLNPSLRIEYEKSNSVTWFAHTSASFEKEQGSLADQSFAIGFGAQMAF